MTWGRPTATSTTTPTATATPTSTPTATPTPTYTPTPTATPTPTSTATATSTATPTATPTPYIGVMIGNVYLRAEPRIGSPLTGATVELNRPVEILAIDGTWYLIHWPPGDAEGTSGWVPGRWVGIISAPPSDIITPNP